MTKLIAVILIQYVYILFFNTDDLTVYEPSPYLHVKAENASKPFNNITPSYAGLTELGC